MTYFLSGQYNAICDRCGFKFKSSELRKDWQGLMVCSKDYEARHPQDFIKVRPEKAIPEWTRPRTVDAFIEKQAVFETFSVLSNEGSQDYIDPTYFLADYIGERLVLVVGFNRSFVDTVPVAELLVMDTGKTLADVSTFTDSFLASFVTSLVETDTVTLSDTGTAILADYVESGYFAELYVGSYTTI